MSDFPTPLYTVAQVRAMDAAAIAGGIPGFELMSRAGNAVARRLRSRWPRARRVGVWCGTGNNGGDGYIVARVLHSEGLDVVVIQVGNASTIKGDAARARADALRTGVLEVAFDAASALPPMDIAIDAMLGIGLRGDVASPWRDAIANLNSLQIPVIAVDVPTGLQADSGAECGLAVRAAMTVTFIAIKRGLLTGRALDLTGEIVLEDLEVPNAVISKFPPSSTRIVADNWSAHRRPRVAHKGDFGHVLVIGGQPGMGGAALLSARAAMAMGAGLVSVATHREHASALCAAQPELMVQAIERETALVKWAARADVVVVGPGLGQQQWGRTMWRAACELTGPLIVDADALNWLAGEPLHRDDWVLTPHPGEAARLLGVSVADIQHDRYAAAEAMQRRYGGVCILKGAGSLVCGMPGQWQVCSAGNPGMAAAGMGDVLTGVIAGLVAQRWRTGVSLTHLAAQAVHLHASAGDSAALLHGERGLSAGELVAQLRAQVNVKSGS